MSKFVCLGDSLTSGYGVRPEECWVSLLAGATGHTFIGAGIPGDTTGGMLARLDESVFANAPDGAVLMGGANDIFATGSFLGAKANMMALVHQCVAKGVRPIVGVAIPMAENAPPLPSCFCDICRAAAEMEAYAHWLRLFAKELRLRVIDFAKPFEDLRAGPERREVYLPDGLHPSVEGHRIMAMTASGHKFLCRR